MAEIAPNFVHPVFHKSVAAMLAELDDQQHVERWYPALANGRAAKPLDLKELSDYPK
jgi:hypothetical protein